MEEAAMRVVRWVLLGAVAVTLGATAGFAAALLRPRQYATFAGVRGTELQSGEPPASS